MTSPAKNLSYNYLGTLALSVMGFITTPYLIGALGVDAFGALALLSTLSGYASLFDLGVGTAGLKLVAERSIESEIHAVNDLYANIVATYLILSAVVLSAGLAILPFLTMAFKIPDYLSHDFVTAYTISLVLVFISFSGASFSGILQGLHDFKALNQVLVVQSACLTVGGLIVALVTHSVVAVIAWQAVVVLGVWIYKAVLLHRKGLRFRPRRVNRVTVREILNFGTGAFVVNVASKIIFETDGITVGAFAGTSAVAAYQVALNPATALRRLGDQLNIVMLGASSRLHAQGLRRELQDLYISAIKYSAVIMLPPAICATFLAKDLLRTWVGQEFEGASLALIVLTWAIVTVNIQGPAAEVLLTLRKQRTLAFVLSMEAIANVVLSVFLLGRLGITGVALGTLLPTLLTAVIYTVPHSAKLIGLTRQSVFMALLKPILAALAATPVLLVVSIEFVFNNVLEVFAAGAFYTVVYGLILVSIDMHARKFIRVALAQLPIARRR